MKNQYVITMIATLILACWAGPVTAAPATHASGLISALELHTLLQEKNQQPAMIVIEVGWGGPKDYYDKGHIPGAIHVNTDEIEYDQFNARATTPADKLGRSTSETEDQAKGLGPNDTLPRNWWNIYPDQYLLPALANMGVTIHSHVVIYAKDPNAATRLAWTMLYAGVDNLQLLNGGLEAWQKAGFDISKQPTARTPLKDFGAERPRHPEYLVNIAFVRDAINKQDPKVVIADIRTRKEYDGITAPYTYIPTKGRIKDAKWGEAGDGPWTMEAYVNSDGTFKRLQEIEQMWAKNGITRDKHVAFYCGTGWRSSLAFYFAYMMGWPQISNFDSGWYEWSMGPEATSNPVIK